jgi:hypothetical protein
MNLVILHCAALLVPREQRAGWLAEWRSELFYVSDRHRKTTEFCLGAFRDAIWVRRNSPLLPARWTLRLASPFQCLSFLALLAATATFFAFHLSLPRDLLMPAPYRHAQDLAMISSPSGSADVPSVSVETYQSLLSRMQYRFFDLAFYRPVRTWVPVAGRPAAELTVAFSTRSLLELLNIPIGSPVAGQNGPVLLLSERVWRKHFDDDSRVLGRVLRVAGKQARVAGVVPADWWRLPGRVDAWLVEEDGSLAAHPPAELGFVVGHVRPQGLASHRTWRWSIAVPNLQGYYDSLSCVWLVPPGSLLPYFTMLFPALLIVAVTTNLTLSEYPAKRADRHTTGLRRWMFFITKCTLLLPIVFFGSFDLTDIISSPGIAPLVTLAGYVLGFRWALMDQRARCPVCLRLLTGPIRVGCASRVFLAWYGTELLCPKGHGLMHVPEILTSSYSAQRWLQLDPSWKSLFS